MDGSMTIEEAQKAWTRNGGLPLRLQLDEAKQVVLAFPTGMKNVELHDALVGIPQTIGKKIIAEARELDREYWIYTPHIGNKLIEILLDLLEKDLEDIQTYREEMTRELDAYSDRENQVVTKLDLPNPGSIECPACGCQVGIGTKRAKCRDLNCRWSVHF
jgi:hypothetical protein